MMNALPLGELRTGFMRESPRNHTVLIREQRTDLIWLVTTMPVPLIYLSFSVADVFDATPSWPRFFSNLPNRLAINPLLLIIESASE